MGLDEFSLCLGETFFSGKSVSGFVKLRCGTDLTNINHIQVKIVGFAHVQWNERIKVVFFNITPMVSVPPVTKGERSTIWNPFSQLHVDSMQERRYIFDPTVLNIDFISNEWANHIMKPASGMDLSPANISVVSSLLGFIGWKVTVSCPFTFSAFPFDRQKCNLTMVIVKLWFFELGVVSRFIL